MADIGERKEYYHSCERLVAHNRFARIWGWYDADKKQYEWHLSSHFCSEQYDMTIRHCPCCGLEFPETRRDWPDAMGEHWPPVKGDHAGDS